MLDQAAVLLSLVGDLDDADTPFETAVAAVDDAGMLHPMLLREAFKRTEAFVGVPAADRLASLLASLYVRSQSRQGQI